MQVQWMFQHWYLFFGQESLSWRYQVGWHIVRIQNTLNLAKKIDLFDECTFINVIKRDFKIILML
jgi:hypothetical protein